MYNCLIEDKKIPLWSIIMENGHFSWESLTAAKYFANFFKKKKNSEKLLQEN